MQATAQAPTIFLEIGGSGAGAVRSSDGSLACASSCTRPLPMGAQLLLAAAAGAGARFAGWAGACSGPGDCALTVSGDVHVTASFEKEPVAPPPSPPEPRVGFLVVKRSGAGRIVSTERGIDCGGECLATFYGVGPVALQAEAADGYTFTGWGGACSGRGPCSVNLPKGATAVSAIFEKLPPRPAECAGLMPEALPPPIVFATRDAPRAGTSDATGQNFLLTTWPEGDASGTLAYHFVQIVGGAAQEMGVQRSVYDVASGQFPLGAGSEPWGFEIFRSVQQMLAVDRYAPDGTHLGSSTPEQGDVIERRVPPSGGLALLKWVWSADHSYKVLYSRFDAEGQVLAHDVPVDLNGGALPDWGVDGQGNVLILSNTGRAFSEQVGTARWLDAFGTPITDWFSIGTFYEQNLRILLTQDGLAFSEGGDFTKAFRSGFAGLVPIPKSLADRPRQRLVPVHGGATYVSLGPDEEGALPTLCGDGMEVVTAAGISCGCLGSHDLLLNGYLLGVGPDGSAIAARLGGYGLYPALVR